MLKRLFSGQINSIMIAAVLVAASSLASRFLGIFRDRILAGEFGAGDMLDIYYAAFRIPDLIFNLLVLGALSAGFVPILIGLIKDFDCKHGIFCPKNKDAWLLVNNIINIFGVILIVLTLLGVFFAPILTRLVVPGFTGEKFDLTVALTRIMFLSPMFLGISSVLGGVLQSFKRFFTYSLAPIFYNLGIIVGALYFVPRFGVYGLAWGVVLGAAMHMLVQLPTVFQLGYRYRPTFDYRNAEIIKIAIMMVPRTMSLAISQINLVVITIIASTLASGSLTIFNFANNLQSFPIGIFGISFAVAAFPSLSAAAFDRKKLVKNFSSTIRQILFFIVPSTVLFLTLRAQIIRVVFGTGEFNWENTTLTIDTLGFFAISLFAQACLPLLVRVFYARHDSKTPFFIGLISVVLNVGLSLWLPKIEVCKEIILANGQVAAHCAPLGIAGLALAFSIANIVNFFLLWIMIRLELGNMDEKRILVSVAKFSAAAFAAGVVVQGMKLIVWPYIDMTRLWGVFTQGFIAGVSGILVYIAFCSLFRSEELYSFWEAIKRRLPKQKVVTGDRGEARGI